jgi:hypothetical protein
METRAPQSAGRALPPAPEASTMEGVVVDHRILPSHQIRGNPDQSLRIVGTVNQGMEP